MTPRKWRDNHNYSNTCSKMADQLSLYLREATSFTLGTCGLQQTKQHLTAAGPQVPFSFKFLFPSGVFLFFLEFGSFGVWFCFSSLGVWFSFFSFLLFVLNPLWLKLVWDLFIYLFCLSQSPFPYSNSPFPLPKGPSLKKSNRSKRRDGACLPLGLLAWGHLLNLVNALWYNFLIDGIWGQHGI